MVAVGHQTEEQRTAIEGWWRVYSGMCEVLVDVAFLKGSYFVHAESNPRSTMPDDAFSWGDEEPLCVKFSDFRSPNANQCRGDDIAIPFTEVNKSWCNLNKVEIFHSKRIYENRFRTQVAGIQRVLSIIGYDVGDIDGVIGEKTVLALNEVSTSNDILGFDFAKVFPLLEKIIAEQQRV